MGGAEWRSWYSYLCFALTITALTSSKAARPKRAHSIAQFVTVERRIAPPPAVPERSVPVSEHSAPQCLDAGHAYRAGDRPHAPASSHRGSVHAARGGSSRV